MKLFSADNTLFLEKFQKNFLPPKTYKNRPQKLLIIPLDQESLFQQVFALWY